MSSITRLLLNLSINVKLGIASGLGVLLVGTMVITQMYANTAKRDLDARMSEQQTIARDAVEVKASIAGMQIAVRDLRLANSAADLKKAVDNLAARLKSANHFPTRCSNIQIGRKSYAHREAQGAGGRVRKRRRADCGRSQRSDRRRRTTPQRLRS